MVPGCVIYFFYLSCKTWALKNLKYQYFDTLDKDRKEDILKKVVKMGKMQRKKQREKQADLRLELSRRQEVKRKASRPEVGTLQEARSEEKSKQT